MHWDRQMFVRRFSLFQPQAYRHHLRQRQTGYPHHGMRHAAVLIGIVERDGGCHIILTKRAKHLRHHPGQVSFPGGKQENGDANLRDTAVRETKEEIGINAEEIDVIGQLPALVTSSGFLVTPFVAMINPNYELLIDRNEVADVFEVPLAYLLNAKNVTSLRVSRGNRDHRVYAIPYQKHIIWGATAQIIESLQRQCR
jgi:8-oxo-dGTP pyrophosphatase MutT (NUDIX family)